MQIRVGFEMIYDCPQPTPMIFTLNVHFTRVSDLVGHDNLVVDPPVPMAAYRDSFGNWCTRIVAPKGLDPTRIKILHDAFNRALDDPEYDRLLKRLDMVDWYKSSEDYAEWAVDQFGFQRALIERTIGFGGN